MSGRLVCWKCHQPISPGQQFLNAVGHTWHEQCFSCRNCSRSLGTGEFYTVNSEPFCAQCHVTQDVPNCAKCHQPVHRGVDFLKYEGQSYHARCFTCEGCSRELSTADFFKVDGRRYCSPCSDNMTSQANSYSGGYSSNPSYGNSNSSPSSNRNSSPYSNSGASSYGSGSGASSYGSASSPSSYGNNSSSSSYAAAKPVSTYGGYNDNPTSSYGSNKPTSTYGSSSSSYAAAKPVSSYDSFNDDHHNHNDDDNNIDYSAEISIGVVPTSDTMTASHHATHHDHDDYNDHHNDHHHGHDNHHHHNGEENGNEDQSDLNALVRELESSGSDFNSKYGGSGYQAGGNAGGGDESDPLAAALRSLQEFDDH